MDIYNSKVWKQEKLSDMIEKYKILQFINLMLIIL
nr:MAG TPA: hypothetical protein [Caudoviricetes sp.]